MKRFCHHYFPFKDFEAGSLASSGMNFLQSINWRPLETEWSWNIPTTTGWYPCLKYIQILYIIWRYYNIDHQLSSVRANYRTQSSSVEFTLWIWFIASWLAIPILDRFPEKAALTWVCYHFCVNESRISKGEPGSTVVWFEVAKFP